MVRTATELGDAWERYREYLSLLARLQLDRRWQRKVDLSGVVQQTLLEAHLAENRLASGDEGLRTAWLRQVLANNLRDEIRKLGTGARDIDREQPLRARLDESSARLENLLIAEQSSPSQQVVRNEQLLALAHALAQLPAEQRDAVEQHHLKGQPLAAIAEQMGRGVTARPRQRKS